MPIFIKFDGVEGAVNQTGHKLERLGDAFEDLGDGFVKLVFDATAETGDFKFLPAVQMQIKHDLLLVAHDFIKVGFDFDKLDPALHKFDDFVLKIADPFLKITPSTDGDVAPIPLADDFKSYESDIKGAGLDFIKAGVELKLDIKFDNTSSLGLAFGTLSDDFLKLGTDASHIGSDALKISQLGPIDKIDKWFGAFGADELKLSEAYVEVSADFHKLAQDFTPATTGDTAALVGPIKFDQAIVQDAGDFIKLASDLQTLNTELRAVGGETIKLTQAIEPSGNDAHFKLS